MTTATQERLRRGRELAAQRRRHAEDQQLADFRAWLRLEADAHAATVRARATYGPRSAKAHAAEREWLNALQLNPGLPSDAAFKRERGELDDA